MFRFLAGSRGLRTRIAAKSCAPRAYIILRAGRFVNSQLKCGADIRRRRQATAERLPRAARREKLCAAGRKRARKSGKIRIYPLSVYQKRRCRPGAPRLTSGSGGRKNESRPMYDYIHRSGKNSREKYFLISINNPDASAFSASVISKTAAPAGV